MNLKPILFITCFSNIAITVYGQSGWTREKSSIFLKLDYSSLSASKYYDHFGIEYPSLKFTQNSVNLYGEYGFSEKLTLITSMPLLRKNSFETTEKVSGIGDLRLEFKYRLTSNELPVSLSIAPEFPTGRSNAFAKDLSNPLYKINLPTGDGEFNLWATLAASKSFGKAYVSAFGSFNFRTKYEGQALQDLYQIGAEIGFNPISDLWLNAKIRAQFAAEVSKNQNLSFLRGDGTSYTLLSGEAFYKISEHFGVSATYLTGGSWIAPFNNIYIAPYFSFGVIYEL